MVVVLKCGRRDPRSDSPRTGLVGGGHSEAQQVRKGMGGVEGGGGSTWGLKLESKVPFKGSVNLCMQKRWQWWNSWAASSRPLRRGGRGGRRKF